MSKTNYTFLKTITLGMMLIVGANQLSAQSVNNGIFFQAVARDNFSNPAKERKIYVQSSVIQTTTTGPSLLVEQFQVNTDGTGMFSISIGNGTRVGGTASGLNAIDWSQGPFYLNLKIAITPAAGNVGWDYTKEWVNIGTTSFGAVPYALYSANAGGVNQKLSITDTTKMLAVYAKSQAVQALSTTVETKLSAKDTLTMLAPYAKAAYVLDSAYIKSELKSKVTIADSATSYVTPSSLSTAISTSVNAGTLTGTILKSTVTGSSLTSVGTLTSGTISLTTNITTSGALKTGTVTYPNTHGTSGQLLSTTGSGTLTWTNSSGVPYTGATGAVNLGAYDLKVNGLTVGRGNNKIDNNVAIGQSALSSTTTGFQGNYITAVGYEALKNDTWGYFNTGIGSSALFSNTTGFANTAVGSNSLYNNTTANYNTAVGVSALGSNTTGENNTASGAGSLQYNTTGEQNSAFGKNTLSSNTTGSINTATGTGALSSNTAGGANNAYGANALLSNTTGSNNNATGFNSLYSNTTAVSNNAYGTNALYSNTIGYSNNAFGFQSLYTNTIGSANTGYGQSTLYLNTTGSNNTAIGYSALDNNTTGSNNTAIGYEADVSSNNLSNATAIGNGAIVSESNTIQLGNTSVTNLKTSGTITANAITYPNTAGTNGQVLTSNGSGTASWQSKSAVSHSKLADATTASEITVGNLKFRFNTSTGSVEVLTLSGYKNMLVFATKKTYTVSISGGGGTSVSYYNIEGFDSGLWKPIINLYNFTAPASYRDLITIDYYQTIEFHMHNQGGDLNPIMPNESYKVFVTKDGYGLILLRVDFTN